MEKLKDLHYKHGAGKGDFIMEAYEEIFNDLKDKQGQLLELGIWKGGSLRMWKDFFPNMMIHGTDRNPKWMIRDEKRIITHQVDQKDIPKFMSNVVKQFDIIIDDCSHVGSLTRQSFRYLFDNNLKSGGIYVIEDWQTGYRDKKIIDGQMFDYEGKTYTGENHTAGMVGFIKELIDELSLAEITDERYGNGKPPKESTIAKMVIKRGIVFLWKK